MPSEDGLLVGVAEVEITPPIGTPLCGGLRPRKSVGVDDPLCVKAVVIESGGTRIAYVIFDLIALARAEGDAGAARASERTGIPADHIVWAASHTHTGPYTAPLFSDETDVDRAWLATIPSRLAETVARADAAKAPARMSRCRAFQNAGLHNRRVLYKDGRAINTWNLSHAGDVQTVGSAGPVDPEIGLLAFDDEAGNLVAVLFHYTLHTNVNFGPRFSADYPGVVAARLRERFGPQVSTLFLPGAFADINVAGRTYRQVGDALAASIIPELERRRPCEGPVQLGAIKRDVTVPYRDLTADYEERIARSGWGQKNLDVFRHELALMRQEGVTEAATVLQAWRIGEVGFASLPGELFVDWGLKIKRESPFDWTYPVELGGDYLGYLVTEQAWAAGGYESLVARSAKPSAEGSARLVDGALAMLGQLHLAESST